MKKRIAFVGIDGAGKTTIIEEIKKNLEKSGKICAVEYMGFGRNLHMPFLKNAIRKYSTKKYFYRERGEIKRKPTKRKNYRIRSFSWLLVYYSELLIRYFKTIFTKSDYVFYDRYFYDGLVFSNKKNFKWLSKLIPRPNKSFLIYAPPKVIRGRKKEAELKDIRQFYEKMKIIGENFDIKLIDNTRRLDIVIKEIMEDLNEK